MSGRAGPGATPRPCRLSRPRAVLTWPFRWSSPRSHPPAASCATSSTARTWTRCSSCAGARVRQKRNGEPFLKLQLGDLTRLGRGGDVGRRARTPSRCACAGTVIRVAGRFSVDARYGAGITVRALRAAAEGEYDLVDLTEAPPDPVRADGRRPRCADGHRPAAAPARAAAAAARPLDRGRRALARGAGREVLPPGLPPRTARALPLGGPGRERAGRHLPRPSTGTWPSPAPCSTTSASWRPTPGPARPSSSPTPASCSARSRSGTSGSGTEMDAHRGLPAGHRPGRAPHHPEPPRQARARQPRGPVHARGHARPLHRQPRAATSGASTGSRRASPTESAWSDFDRGISASAYFAPSRGRNRREAA